MLHYINSHDQVRLVYVSKVTMTTHCTVTTLTHATETRAINRLHFLAPVVGASFSYDVHLDE